MSLDRQDWRAALVASVIANVNRDPNKGEPFSPEDFMPTRAKARREKGTDWRQLLSVVEHINIQMGGQDLRAEKSLPEVPDGG